MSTLSGGPNIVVDGLVLYLDAANRYSYVSGSTAWNDLSRSSNNGTLINGPTFNTGSGGSIVFDGVDDRVNMNTNSLSNGNQPFSVCAWINTSISNRELFFGLDQQSHLDINAFNVTNSNTISFHRYNVFVMYAPTNSIKINTPQHVCWTYNGTTMDESNAKMYANGNMLSGYQFSFGSSGNAYNFNTSTANYISNLYTTFSGAQQFRGNAYQLQVYNRALSSQEILQNYNTTKTRFGL
jgi:hypothetical protein